MSLPITSCVNALPFAPSVAVVRAPTGAKSEHFNLFEEEANVTRVCLKTGLTSKTGGFPLAFFEAPNRKRFQSSHEKHAFGLWAMPEQERSNNQIRT